jgi:hypothetical protein
MVVRWVGMAELCPPGAILRFYPFRTPMRNALHRASLVFLFWTVQRETWFRMNEDDIERWIVEERHMIQVARAIQLRYGITFSLVTLL